MARAANESARSFAYRIIKIQILGMQFLPGAKLSEAELAQLLGVSRTPVHDTFARLEREKMLMVEPQRGTFVPLLDTGHILQVAGIEQKLSLAVLEVLYIRRPTAQSLAELFECVHKEREAVAQGAAGRMAQLQFGFFRQLFAMAGYLPVFQAAFRVSADLTRLYHLVDDMAVWRKAAELHDGVAQALQARDSDDACERMAAYFSMVGPLLSSIQERYPQYFRSSELAAGGRQPKEEQH